MKNINDLIKKLPPERRAKVEARKKELIREMFFNAFKEELESGGIVHSDDGDAKGNEPCDGWFIYPAARKRLERFLEHGT